MGGEQQGLDKGKALSAKKEKMENQAVTQEMETRCRSKGLSKQFSPATNDVQGSSAFKGGVRPSSAGPINRTGVSFREWTFNSMADKLT